MTKAEQTRRMAWRLKVLPAAYLPIIRLNVFFSPSVIATDAD